MGSWTKNGEEQIIYDATQSRYWKFQDSKPDVVEEGSWAQDGERKMRGKKNKTKHEDDGNDDDDGKWEWRAGLNCIAFIGGDGRKKRVVQRKDGRKRNSRLGDITRYTLNEDNNLLFGEILRFLLSILPLFLLLSLLPPPPSHKRERQQETNFSKICLRANKSRFYRVTWFIRKCCCTCVYCCGSDMATTTKSKGSSERYQQSFLCSKERKRDDNAAERQEEKFMLSVN